MRIFVVRTNISRSFHPNLKSAIAASAEVKKKTSWREVTVHELELDEEYFLGIVLPLLNESEYGDFKYCGLNKNEVIKDSLISWRTSNEDY